MRVLLVAPTASKKFGGEAILPVHWFGTLRSLGVDVELLTHSRAREELYELFPEDQSRIHFVEDTWLHRCLDAPSKWLPRRLHEVSFAMALDLATQRDMRRVGRRIVDEGKVDLVHILTPVSPRAPSLLQFDVATIFGPMNGGMAYPAAFRHRDSLLTRSVVRVGRLAAFGSSLLFRGKRNADLLLVANERTRLSLPSTLRNVACESMVENGVETALWGSACRVQDERREVNAIRLVTIGRLVDCKAVDQLLHAIAGLDVAQDIHLDVVGDGPERASLEELSRRLGLERQVHFLGFLSQEECRRQLEQADIFVLPSLHECGGAAVLESMAAGVPVIAANWGGPADYLSGDYGVLVEPNANYIESLRTAIVELCDDRERREQLANAARQRVQDEFDWEAKGRQMLEVYERIVRGS